MAEKIRIKGQLKLPVVGKNPTFAQMKFVKVALSEQDILPDSGSIFTCDEQGNYDFEIYTGKHLLSYNVGNSWSKQIEIIAEPLADGLESIEISDLIGFQEIPELDATIAALNQQKQELLLIQQDVVVRQSSAAASAAAAAADAAKLADVTPESIGAVSNESGLIIKPAGYSHSTGADPHGFVKIQLPELPRYFTLRISTFGSWVAHSFDLLINASSSGSAWTDVAVTKIGGSASASIKACSDGAGHFLVIGFGSSLTYQRFYIESASGFSGNPSFTITSSATDATPSEQVVKSLIVEPLSTALSPVTVSHIEHGGAVYQSVSENQIDSFGITIDQFEAALAQQQAQDFFESEKAKAILIMSDHMLGTGEEEITDLQVMDVKAYIQSIDPAKGLKVGIVREKVPRPSIFSRYD